MRYILDMFAPAFPAFTFVALAAALSLPLPVRAQAQFAGAWVASICEDGASRNAGECATFVLELMERDGTLCGSHMFATAGAARIDEGAAPSLTADIGDVDGSGSTAGTAATGTAISRLGETALRLPVELRLADGTLHWKRLDKEKKDDTSEKTLLPRKARLTKSSKRTLFAPLFEQELRAACVYVFNLAAVRAAPALPGDQGGPAPIPSAPAPIQPN